MPAPPMCQTPLPPPSLHARVISAGEQDGGLKSCSSSALQAEETVRRTTSLFFARHRSAHRHDAKHQAKEAPCAVPAGAVNWRGGRTAEQRKTGQRKTRYGSHQQSASSSSQKKSTQENTPEPACHSYAKTVRAVLTTPDDALCCGACQYRARCLGEREVRWGLVEVRRGSWGPGNPRAAGALI